MAKFISIVPWGSASILYMQNRLKLKGLIEDDDKRLDYDSVASLPLGVLHTALYIPWY